LRETEELDGANLLAEDGRGNIFGTGALHSQRPHVGLGHRHVEPEPASDATGQQHHIGIGDGEPEAVGRKTQHDRIVDQQTVIVDNRGAPAPTDGERAQVGHHSSGST
jgi:hypothetical protein